MKYVNFELGPNIQKRLPELTLKNMLSLEDDFCFISFKSFVDISVSSFLFLCDPDIGLTKGGHAPDFERIPRLPFFALRLISPSFFQKRTFVHAALA